MTTRWTERYAARVQAMQGSAIREILKVTQQPEVISFAGGLPAPELFPMQEVIDATRRVMEGHGREAMQYSITEGYLPLREMIMRHMSRYGIHCTERNVMITTGSQQALDLIGKVMIDPGDLIAVEEPTYLGALQAWNVFGAQYVTVATDDEGMVPDGLELALQARPIKFIYALPNFQNPMGVTLSHERRLKIVRLAEKYGVPIIEDDPYGQLRYEGGHEPTLIGLDAMQRGNSQSEHFISGNVIYLSTFSKTLCPGFRVAWVVGPEEVIARMVQAKQAADLHSSTFAQMVAYETGRNGFLDHHVREIRRVYHQRRDLMLGLLEEMMPPDTTWTHPMGGLFLWLRLPEGINSTDLLAKAVEQKVAFVPGSPFYPHGGGENTMRLNFSNATPEQIEIGMARLAEVIQREIVSASPPIAG